MNDVKWRVAVVGSPHAAIIGMSGQGKSVTVTTLQKQLAASIPTLVLDFHGDLSEKMSSEMEVVDVAKSGLPFNPFDPYQKDARGITQYALDFSEILQAVCGLGAMQKVQVYRALMASYESAKTVENAQSLPTMKDFSSQLQFLEAQNRGVNSSARLLNITEFELFDENADSGFNPKQTNVVFNLSGLGSEELKRVSASLVLRKVYSQMKSWEQKHELQLAVFLDEAHLMSKETVLGKLYKEARKYGVCMILASQSIQDFSTEVLENVGLKMVFKLNNPGSIAGAKFLGTPNVANLAREIEELKVGTAIVSLQNDASLKRVVITLPD
jgi:DNA helicase HerA-like ATPase